MQTSLFPPRVGEGYFRGQPGNFGHLIFTLRFDLNFVDFPILILVITLLGHHTHLSVRTGPFHRDSKIYLTAQAIFIGP